METTNFKMPEFDSPKNFPEDYPSENGNYICKCYKCKENFYGYKRRVVCKECQEVETSKEVLQVENNGWIKIESEEHIRNLEISYKTYHGAMDEFVFDSAFNRDSLLKYYKNGELNYYQPIQKPEPPKF